MSTKLFVGNLSFQTTENELQNLFSTYGKVVETNLILDKLTGRPRGFGFVSMSTPEEAQSAIEALHGYELGGRPLTVNEARPREDRPSGGGRSFGGGARNFGNGGGVGADGGSETGWGNEAGGGGDRSSGRRERGDRRESRY